MFVFLPREARIEVRVEALRGVGVQSDVQRVRVVKHPQVFGGRGRQAGASLNSYLKRVVRAGAGASCLIARGDYGRRVLTGEVREVLVSKVLGLGLVV